ncbi:MAG: ArgE/DapE family deacylase [Culicoidibacterales bacterium]
MEQQQKIEILQKLIQIDTTNGNEAAAASYLADVFHEFGIASEQLSYCDERANLIVEVGTGNKTLGFSGHLDVVSAGNHADWTYPPFSATHSDGKIYGRGATDMKAGLAAAVVAMIELAQDPSFSGKLKLLATVGEEIGLLGARQLTEQGYVDGIDAMIIGEPTQNTIVFAHKGVFSYRVESRGVSAHSSVPELGKNAIDKLIAFYISLQAELGKITAHNEVLGAFVHNTSLIEGGTQINSVPDYAQIVGNVRTIPEFDNEKIEQLLRDVIAKMNDHDPESDLRLVVTQSSYPMFSQPEAEIVKIAQTVGEAIIGQKIPCIGISGGTDACEFTRGNPKMPIIIFGPGNETPHMVDEYVEVANYLQMIEVYQAIAKQFFAGV